MAESDGTRKRATELNEKTRDIQNENEGNRVPAPGPEASGDKIGKAPQRDGRK